MSYSVVFVQSRLTFREQVSAEGNQDEQRDSLGKISEQIFGTTTERLRVFCV